MRNGEFAPIIAAEAKGFFAEEGIAHRIIDGSPGRNPVPIVAMGQAQFGVATSGLYLLAARTARDPVDVVAVGALYQKTPSAFLTVGDPGDREPTPKKLEGKTSGVQAGSKFFGPRWRARTAWTRARSRSSWSRPMQSRCLSARSTTSTGR